MATPARLVDRLVDERDIALSGTRVLSVSGMRLLGDDRQELPGAMRAAYKQLSDEQGDVPSPVAAKSETMMWPDCSPPSDQPRRRISSST